jgi:HEAT repeat protein
MKEKDAVPALISVLDRCPDVGGAAFALGEIGDKRAIPVLMKLLENRSDWQDDEVTALGKLKHKEAVPILISRLGHPRTTFSDMDIIETEILLEALLAIGDRRAIEPIREYLDGVFPEKSKAAAKRVIAQLDSADPPGALLALLNQETYEPERSSIIGDLTKYRDNRIVENLSVLAHTSDSAFMRREAIFGLRTIGDKQAALALASLLEGEFPSDLKAEWGWKGVPDFSKYFPEIIVNCLRQCTKQDFGVDRAKWEVWIKENFNPDRTGDKH